VGDDENGTVRLDAEVDLGCSEAASALVRKIASCARSVSGTKREATMNATADSTPPRNWRRL
jgi:hypothetical protein